MDEQKIRCNDSELIKKIPTCVLFEELKTREGVDAYYIAPYDEVEVKASGPATVLVVID
ncbi:MAG: BC1881 family protein [Clostridiales bacterium]|nr:BC1881 family protein [Clostridiales bacterium]